MASNVDQTQSFNLPIPLAGLNFKDPLDRMDPNFALALDNFFPDNGALRIRGGSYQVDRAFLPASTFYSMIETVRKTGTRDLFICANHKAYVWQYLTNYFSLDFPGAVTSDDWNLFVFKHYLFFVNGVDTPASNLLGVGALVPTGFTGPADIKKLVQGCGYKSRLYFLESGTASLWYGGVSYITGALTEFPFGDQLQLGGYPMFCGTQTSDEASSQNLFIVVSSMGEVLVWNGDYPGSDTWYIQGRYFIAPPLGRKSYFYAGNDLHFITEQGVFPFSNLIGNVQTAGRYQSMSEYIDPKLTDSIRQVGNFTNWQGINFPQGKMIIINVPTDSSGQNFEQYVQNTISKAWCHWTIPAVCWVTFDRKLYYVTANGGFFQAEYGTADFIPNIYFPQTVPVPIKTFGRTAFSNCGIPFDNKLFGMVQAVTNSAANFNLGLEVDIDFAQDILTNVPTVTKLAGADWDVDAWDAETWGDSSTAWHNKDQIPTQGYGRYAAVKFGGNFQGFNFKIYSFNLSFKEGGLV